MHIPALNSVNPVRYIMGKTVDGGTTWKSVNENPFNSKLGVTQGLLFFDENFGIAGLTGADQSYSALYVTRDKGVTFEEIVLPMSKVAELPKSAEN